MATIRTRPTCRTKPDGSPILHYTATIRLKGVTKNKTFKNRTLAERWAQAEETRIRNEYDQGTLVTESYQMQDAIRAYREHELEHLASQWNYTLKVIEHYLGNMKLAELKQTDILSARSKYKKSRDPHLSNSTCNKFTTCLRNVCKLARRLNMMNHDPFRDFKRLGEEGAKRKRYLSDEEREALLKEAKVSKNPHLSVIVFVALMTGFRKSTIRYLRWSNIDFVENMIRLTNAMVNEEGKRGKPRSANVPIVPELRVILEDHYKKYGSTSEFLFPSPEDPNRPIDFQTAWRVARKNAQLKDFKFHDLRATCATYLGKMKVPLHIMQQILGHSDPKMTMKYVQTVEETVSNEMKRVFAKIFSKETAESGR